ncbi:MAG TPA: HAMP domain-containing sensor histidine kinase [Candidatus Limnocylindria bacterium]
MMRGRPLAVRLAALLAGVVVVVLLAAGVIVNRAASRSLEEQLGPREQQRVGLAVAIVEEALERGDGRGVPILLRRIANETGGEVRVVGPDDEVLYRTGGPPLPDETDTISTELSAAAGGGTLELEVPSTQAPILRAFNTALLVTGIVAVAALLLAAVVVASRVTRPLRGVAAAAHRLGGGDLGARAEGGPDAESAELASAFNGMAERLERSETLRRRAASDLAHDLATPATVLESQLQAMVDGVVPADAAELEKARAAAASLSGVILQLGELTQAESAPLQRQPHAVALGELASEIVAALDGLLRERSVTAHVEGAATVLADRGQLARALRNVVTNAIQHAGSGGGVRIEVTAGPRPTVRVRDTGAGIAEGDRPFVFERFYRADRSRGGPRSGSGIGLTVARELIVANGGTIEIESTGSHGSTFRIELPAG